jgi:divalent metal cation (Fe/Co/Zn/Cd) transporter
VWGIYKMEEIIRLIIGVLFLIIGIPLGSYLAKITKEELSSGQKWFRLIIIVGLIGGAIGLIVGNDVILFSFFFIAIVTSRGLKKNS